MDDNTTTSQVTNDPFASVRFPEYKNLILGRFTFIMALRMMSTLVGWWVYELTQDPFAIGLVGLSEVVPALSMALYSGHVIDISEKRKLLLKGVFDISVQLLFCYFFPHHLFMTASAITQLPIVFMPLYFAPALSARLPDPYFQYADCDDCAPAISSKCNNMEPGKLAFGISDRPCHGGFLIALVGNMGTMIVICCLMITAFFILSR